MRRLLTRSCFVPVCFTTSSQTRIAPLFLFHWPVPSSWIEPGILIITSAPSFLPLIYFLFSSPPLLIAHLCRPVVLFKGAGQLKRDITSASLPFVRDTGSGRGCVFQAEMSRIDQNVFVQLLLCRTAATRLAPSPKALIFFICSRKMAQKRNWKVRICTVGEPVSGLV